MANTSFDPDTYVSSIVLPKAKTKSSIKTESSFNPDAYVASIPKEQFKSSPLEVQNPEGAPAKAYNLLVNPNTQSFLSSLGSGMTLGFAKPLIGAVGAGIFHPAETAKYLTQYYSGKAPAELPQNIKNVMQATSGRMGKAEEAAPLASTLGGLVSYAVPYSGEAKLYKVGEQLAGKAVGAVPNLLKKAPGLIQAASKNVIQPAIKSATGFATSQLGRDVGEVVTGQQPIQNIPQDVKGAAVAGAVAGPAGEVVKGMGGIAAKLASKYVGQPLDAMLKFIKNPEAIKSAYGTEKDIGNQLIGELNTMAETGHPLYPEAKAILSKMSQSYKEVLPKIKPYVDLVAKYDKYLSYIEDRAKKISLGEGSPMKSMMRKKAMSDLKEGALNLKQQGIPMSAPGGVEPTLHSTIDKFIESRVGSGFLLPEEETLIKKVRDLKESLPKSTPADQEPNKNIVAKSSLTIDPLVAEQLKHRMQQVIKPKYGKIGSGDLPAEYIDLYKNLASNIRANIEDASVQYGSPEYIDKMKTIAQSMSALDEVRKLLGKTFGDQPDKAEKLVSNILKGGSVERKLSAYDVEANKLIPGREEIVGQAKNAAVGRQFGGPTPPWVPSRLSAPLALTAIGGTVGGLMGSDNRGGGIISGAAGAAIPFALSSPRAMTSLISGGLKSVPAINPLIAKTIADFRKKKGAL